MKNFSEVISQIKPNLVDYLKTNGIKIDKHTKISCMFPNHEDSTPSMSLMPGEEELWCFGCNRGVDIFTAANILENKPLSGPGFLLDNVQYLAEMYNIQIDLLELSDEEKHTYQIQRVYNDILNIIKETPLSDEVRNEFEHRGWLPWEQELRMKGIGCTPGTKELFDKLTGYGWDKDLLKKVGATRSDIFSPTKLIFTVKNKHSQPVLFVARDLLFKENGNTPKYTSTPKIDIVHPYTQEQLWPSRGKTLFGIENIKGLIRKNKTRAIYIVEGEADATTLSCSGIPAVAVGSGTLTQERINLLSGINYTKLIMCFDNDEAGRNKTQESIDSGIKSAIGTSIKICSLPDGAKDPDECLRSIGKDEFLKLPTKSVFEWSLELKRDGFNLEDEDDAFAFCEEISGSIATESNPLDRGKYCRLLSRLTGIKLEWINERVNQLVSLKEEKQQQEINTIVKKFTKEMQASPNTAHDISLAMNREIERVKEEYKEDKFSISETLQAIHEQKDSEDTKTGGFEGYVIPDFPIIQNTLDGDWSKGLFLISGYPGAGKTSFLGQLAINILLNNDGVVLDQYNEPTKDTIIIYHSIDDSREIIANRFLTYLTRIHYKAVTFNKIRGFINYIDKRGESQDLAVARERAYSELFNLISSNRLYIKDINIGSNLGTIERFAMYLRDNHPNQKILYFYDNISKTNVPGFDPLSPAKDSVVSQTLKSIANIADLTFISTVENRKSKDTFRKRPTDNDIMGAIQQEYEATQIMHMFCPLGSLGIENTQLLWARNEQYKEVPIGTTGSIIVPINELGLSKSKIVSTKGVVYLKFVPDQGHFVEITKRQLRDYTEMAGAYQANSSMEDTLESGNSYMNGELPF